MLLTVKIERELRDAFVETCKEMDTTAAREVRQFIRNFLKKHGQRELF